ncbi:ribonuclease D [Paenarthrobacter nicotinovorans]|uniref:Ribonuclease D n=1 Tax=Paenarthrobacter nicotinovorans TaxID=29320 RepID=A0ABV0GMS8_PAENI
MSTSRLPVEVFSGDLSKAAFRRSAMRSVLAWDIETSGLDWSTDKIGTCQIGTQDEIMIVVIDQERPPKFLSALLENPEITKVFHHAPFDLRFMTHHWGIMPTNVECTKIASKILNPELRAEEHSLKPVLRRHLGVEISKVQQISDWLSPDLSEEQLAYAAADVAHLIPLLALLRNKTSLEGISEALEASYSYLMTRVILDIRGSGDVYAY